MFLSGFSPVARLEHRATTLPAYIPHLLVIQQHAVPAESSILFTLRGTYYTQTGGRSDALCCGLLSVT